MKSLHLTALAAACAALCFCSISLFFNAEATAQYREVVAPDTLPLEFFRARAGGDSRRLRRLITLQSERGGA